MKQFFKMVARKWDALGPWAKPAREIVEQIGHAIMAGAPAFLVVFWLPLPWGVQIGLAVAVAVILGGIREYRQNVGDDPEGAPVFFGVPLNLDLVLDMAAYAIGGLVAGVLAGVL